MTTEQIDLQKRVKEIRERAEKAASGPWYSRPDDFTFIAHARQDIPLLLDQLALEQKRVKELEQMNHEKANIHHSSDPQGVPDVAHADTSQGAESDGWTAWLIENGKKQGEGLKYLTMGDLGMFTWTEDHYAALHFARRADAEKVSEECEDAWRIVEHGFGNLTAKAELQQLRAERDELRRQTKEYRRCVDELAQIVFYKAGATGKAALESYAKLPKQDATPGSPAL